MALGEADKCDASCGGNPQFRLSLHTVPKKGGYRLGELLHLNKATNYYKFILTKDADADDIKYEISTNSLHLKRFQKAGFEVKYLKNYGTVTGDDELTAIYESCDANTDIVVGGGISATQMVTLFAKADCREVFAKTNIASNATKSNYGDTYWYYAPGKTFGFSPNKLVVLGEADQCDNSCGGAADGNGGDRRLSWHVELNGGFRLGNKMNLNKNNNYFKVIMTRKRKAKDMKYDYGISTGIGWDQLISDGWQQVYN